MTRRGEFRRVTKAHPCPICGRPDWCLVAGPSDTPTAALCARVESVKRCGQAGWLHRLRDDDAWRPSRQRVRTVTPPAARTADIDIAKLAEAWHRTALESGELSRLAADLGVSVESLSRLGAGWASDRRCWSFPMRSPDGDLLGIRLRLTDGRKLAVRGGHEGLFLPSGLTRGGRLLIAEGASDTAALLDLGFVAVGRPSCTGGAKLLVDLARRLATDDVVIVADADAPGRRGADDLAGLLALYVPQVRVIQPQAGIKDARAWKQAGATRDDVLAAIGAAEPRRLKIRTV